MDTTMIVGMGKQQHQGGGGGGVDKGVDAPKMIACGVLHGGSMFLFHSK